MTIEKHPPGLGFPDTLGPGKTAEGNIKGRPFIAISRQNGFALRDKNAKAGTPDKIIEVGDIVEFDTGVRLVALAQEPQSPAGPYDQAA